MVLHDRLVSYDGSGAPVSPPEATGRTVYRIVQEGLTNAGKHAPGATATVEELEAHCRERLAGFKVPKAVVLLDELPRSSSGKIQKFQLRVEYAELYAGAPGVVAPASQVATS